MTTAVILVAAGAGRRFGRPKILLELGGKTLLERSAAAFDGFAERVAVLRQEDLATVSLPGWTLVAGGSRRRDSVAAGLAAISSDVVLVHDAARPLVTPQLVQRVRNAAWAAVVPVLAVTDTIKEVADNRIVATPDRARLVFVQTPQRFDTALLRRALAHSDRDATDEAALVEALGEPVRTVPGDPRNLKITRPADLAVAEALLAADR